MNGKEITQLAKTRDRVCQAISIALQNDIKYAIRGEKYAHLVTIHNVHYFEANDTTIYGTAKVLHWNGNRYGYQWVSFEIPLNVFNNYLKD